MKEESAGVLPVLDVSVSRLWATLSFSIYRKPTFSGLGTSYFSNIFEKFKSCAVRTLIHRAYYLCSSFSHVPPIKFVLVWILSQMMAFLPMSSIRTSGGSLIKSTHPDRPVLSPEINFYFRLPFYNDSCHDRVRDLIPTLERFIPSSIFPFSNQPVHSGC